MRVYFTSLVLAIGVVSVPYLLKPYLVGSDYYQDIELTAAFSFSALFWGTVAGVLLPRAGWNLFGIQTLAVCLAAGAIHTIYFPCVYSGDFLIKVFVGMVVAGWFVLGKLLGCGVSILVCRILGQRIPGK